MSRQIQRLKKELENITSNPPAGCSAKPCADLITKWEAMITGPEDSPYEGGVFKAFIYFPNEYPFKPPLIIFQTAIFHPNISAQGSVCLNILKKDDWSPTITISNVLTSVRVLLAEPNANDSYNAEAGRLWLHNKPQFDAKAKEWTHRYARQ